MSDQQKPQETSTDEAVEGADVANGEPDATDEQERPSGAED